MNDYKALGYKFCGSGLIKSGDFTLKSGAKSDVYVDMRSLPSYPDILEMTVRVMYEWLLDNEVLEEIDCVCGVPYGAVPLATAFSLHIKKPLIMLRKELKEHGLQRQVEGAVPAGSKVLLLEDVVSSGGSLYEAAKALEEAGYEVVNTVCVLEREDQRQPEIFAKLCEEFGFMPFMHLSFLRSLLNEKPVCDMLSYTEIMEIAASEHSAELYNQGRLIIGGRVDFANEIVTLFTSTGVLLPFRFNVLASNKTDTEPDFTDFRIVDYGHTVALGKYEIATEAILEDVEQGRHLGM